jgi:hypothetical protein
MNKILIALFFIATASHAEDHTVPPLGVVAVTSKEILCVSGYSGTVRPPTSYTNRLKFKWTPAGHLPSEYELDHYIPIALGGSPTDPNNLWLQKWDDAKIKDVQENLLHREMCKGISTPKQVQEYVRKWK